MLFNRDVSRNPEVVLGARFGGFCEWYLRFNCLKHVIGAAQDRLDSVCLFVHAPRAPPGSGRFFDQFEQEFI